MTRGAMEGILHSISRNYSPAKPLIGFRVTEPERGFVSAQGPQRRAALSCTGFLAGPALSLSLTLSLSPSLSLSISLALSLSLSLPPPPSPSPISLALHLSLSLCKCVL